MCGINGIIRFSKKYEAHQMESLLGRMNDAIIHRGPDDDGVYTDDVCSLGMRRLSIIDLTSGKQPIWNENRDKLIVFNGELYNYKEIKGILCAKGHHFYTESDTEVVLHAFEEFGIDALLRKMEGMFAFCIYDIKEKTWHIARDRIGEKPLYYYKDDDLFLFSSELKSINSTGLVDKKIDEKALSIYLQLTYIPAPYTIFSSVRKLRPGTYLTIHSNGNIEEHEYWSLAIYYPTDTLSYDDYKRELRSRMYRAVEGRMISDVPLGAFLSGGFDSSIIVSIMAELSSKPVNTFTVGFENKTYDETNLAALVANRHKTNHIVLHLNEEEMIDGLPALLNNMDEPFADSSLIAVNAISKKAREYVKVVLTGDGGDELFAGYNKYLMTYYGNLYKRVPTVIKDVLVKNVLPLFPSKSYRTMAIRKVINAVDLEEIDQCIYLMSLGFKRDEIFDIIPGLSVDTLKFIKEQYVFLQQADSQTKTQYVDLKTVLEGDMLPKVDRGSMLASIETRVPMLDSNVVELAFQIPTRYKIKGRNRKIILKETFHDLLPKELYHAPKHGFGVPVSDWLESSLKSKLLSYAERELLEEQGLFSYEAIWKIINEHMEHKRDRFSELWAFFVFQNWYGNIIGF